MMKNLLIVLFLLVSSANYSQKDYSFVYNTDSIIKKGIRLHDQTKYEEALIEYDHIHILDPQFLKVQYEKALSLSGAKKKDELKSFFEKLHKDQKMQEYPKLYSLYGSYLSDEKDFVKSEKIFDEGEKYLSNSSIFLYNKALLLIRKGDTQKAITLLEKIIIQNPAYSSAHYFLGLLALENGKITEGTLALMTYLIVAPNGRYAESAILNLNAKFGQNYLDKNKFEFSKTGDNFEEIDIILRNQLPLKSAYKLNSEIDDVIIRQIQAVSEYSLEHKIENGFFETTYLPWVKDMISKKQFEGLSYYILLSMEKKIGKKLTSQKKKITSFYQQYVEKDFWHIFAKRKQEHFGTQEEVFISFDKNLPAYIGPENNGLKNGKFKLLDINEDFVGELNVKNNNLEGIQKYFDKKGNPTYTKTFNNGKLDGLFIEYYQNGNVEIESLYKENKYNGTSKSYYINGGKNCEVNFINDQRDGKMICYFENGMLKSETNYSLGKLNGLYKEYNEAGDLTDSYTYKNGELDGEFDTYYDGKAFKSHGIYNNGKVLGSFKKYYVNGGVEEESKFEKGKIKTSIVYEAKGMKSTESFYNENGELETYIYYDENEKKYFEEKYKSGELKTGLQYSNSNPKPIEINLSKKAFVIKNLEDKVLVSGQFEKGKRVNTWSFYKSNGNLKQTDSYKDGKLNGLTTVYNNQGFKTKIINYSEGESSGLCEIYQNDTLINSYIYEKDILNGPYFVYDEHGKNTTEGFYTKNELNNQRLKYWANGKLSTLDKFTDDVITESITYNQNGEEENNINFKNKTGKFSEKYYSGNTITTYEMTNGVRNGLYVVKDKIGTLIVDSNYKNGVLHGNYNYFSPTGTKKYIYNYYNGKQNGKCIENDLVGNLRLTEEYILGQEYGKTTRYFHNKSKLFEYSQINDSKEGEYIYYNQKGEPILILEFLKNELVFYTTKNKTGELKDKTIVIDQTADIKSNYTNGKIAIQVKFIKGNMEGVFSINNMEGKPEFVGNYTKDLLNGERIEYYSNGKIYKKEHFNNSNFDGTQEYYKEDGKKWLVASYKNDNLQGNTEIYTNGILVLTKKYELNELVEIIK